MARATGVSMTYERLRNVPATSATAGLWRTVHGKEKIAQRLRDV
jgi:hypothetical protein